VATAAEDRLSFPRNPYTSFAASSAAPKLRVLITRRSQRRFYGQFTSVVQKIALTAIVDQADNST
jgi:hypothetical protein